MYKVKCKEYIIHFTSDIIQKKKIIENLIFKNEEKINTGVR